MKHITYAEKCGQSPFNWLRWLQHVRFNASAASLKIKRDMARQWPTCACGNMCAVLPRTSDGRPEDSRLIGSGLNFFDNVKKMHMAKLAGNDMDFAYARKGALATFKGIEARSTELLKGMGVIRA